MDHAIPDRGDRDRADFTAFLGNLSSTIRSGAIHVSMQFRDEFREEHVPAACLDLLERLVVRAGGAAVTLGLQIRRFERVEFHDVDV